MNRAKKIMKNQGLGGVDKKKKKEADVSRKNKILLIIGIALVLVLSLGICYIQFRPREILRVSGLDNSGATVENKVYYKEAMYDIYTTETQYNSYASLYAQMYHSSSYWDAEDVDSAGRTGAQAAKKAVMDGLKQREILYMEALKNDMSLTDEEKKTISESAATAVSNLSDSQKRIAGLDEKTIAGVMEKQALADKYRQSVISSLGIDEEALKKTVSKKDYRQYTLQYYTFAKTEQKDGKEVDKDAATLKKAKSDMKALQKKAASAKDFTKDIITDSDTNNTDDNTGISYSTLDLLETNEDFADDATRKKIKAMKNNAVSDVLETKDAYYVIKMVNNNDSEAYDNQCQQVVADEQTSQFNTKYKNEIKINYRTEVQSYWRGRVTLGALTSGNE
ncbi:MAG: hypothetical protein J1F22_08390 [Lachnospiraceae bacterium]|nr:hypothetical protein [Lachnospiraceae bacterium]